MGGPSELRERHREVRDSCNALPRRVIHREMPRLLTVAGVLSVLAWNFRTCKPFFSDFKRRGSFPAHDSVIAAHSSLITAGSARCLDTVAQLYMLLKVLLNLADLHIANVKFGRRDAFLQVQPSRQLFEEFLLISVLVDLEYLFLPPNVSSVAFDVVLLCSVVPEESSNLN